MVHRVRAAGLLVEDGRLLLVDEGMMPSGERYFVPPGGGLELTDHSLIQCLEREMWEETGIRVVVGEPVYIKEYVEFTRRTHHVELFFRVRRDPNRTDANATADRPNVWMTADELRRVIVFPPELQDGLWAEADASVQCRYLGRTDQGLD